jgi:predicted ester cyclase
MAPVHQGLGDLIRSRASKESEMSEGIGLIEKFYKDVMESGNLDLIDELALDSYVDHEEALPGQPSGKDGVKFFVSTMRSAFPDIKVKEIQPSLSAGNMEACHVVLTGTHRGELAGIPATGKSVEFDCTDIIRVEQGKVAEHWGTTDNLSLMQQIGAVAVG